MFRPKGYICAGDDRVRQYTERFVDTAGTPFADRLVEKIDEIMPDIMFSHRKTTQQRLERRRLSAFEKRLRRTFQSEWTRGKSLFIDSGGYQLQTGVLSPSIIPLWRRMYREVIFSSGEMIGAAFTFDVAPGGGYMPVSEAELRGLNERSIEDALVFSGPLRGKLYAIHHFRTPLLHKVFREVLFTEGRARWFINFATGGMADGKLPRSLCYVSYVLPLVDVVQHLKSRECAREVGFHVLGQADHKDHVTNAVIAEFTRRYHGVNLAITCDSATFFNGCCARTMSVPTILPGEDHLSTVAIPCKDESTHAERERFARVLIKVMSHDDAEDHDPEEVIGLLGEEQEQRQHWRAAAMMIFFDGHRTALDLCNREAVRLTDLYVGGDREAFVADATDLLARLNDGGPTRQVMKRAEKIHASLNLIKNCDPDQVQDITSGFPEEIPSGSESLPLAA